ncbi:hypothetical protein PS3A_16380 [Pseudomonas sp. 3A(2025)]
MIAVAVRVGASFTAAMATLTEAAVLVPPAPSLTVTCTVRVDAVISPVLLLLYARRCSSPLTAAGVAELLRVTTRGLPRVPPA